MIDLTVPGMKAPHIGALDGLMEGRWPLLPLPVVLTHQVDRIPAAVLPHLAQRFHMLHTVAWKRAANDARRRYLIKDAIRRHGLKGTLAGLKLGAEDAGAAVTRAIVPPAKIFASKAMTKDERNAFVARYPQLRLYRHRDRGTIGHVSFVYRHRWFCLVQSDAILRLGERAFLWRQGAETELALLDRDLDTWSAEGVTFLRVAQRGPGGYGFVARYPRCRFPSVTSAKSRIHTMTLAAPYVDRHETLRVSTLTAGLDPLDVRYENIAEKGLQDCLMPGASFAGALSRHNGGRGCLIRSSAWQRVYRKLYLFDPEIDVLGRRVSLHLNEGILTMPHHRARLDVKIRGRMDVKRWAGPWVRGHLTAPGHEALYDCLDAMRDFARGADWIDISTQHVRPAVAGIQHLAGGLTASALTERK